MQVLGSQHSVEQQQAGFATGTLLLKSWGGPLMVVADLEGRA